MFYLELSYALLLVVAIGALLECWHLRAELGKAKDILESRVAERTQELEETQLVRLLELQRFAEFGRLSAHLLHDVSNPLTAASLNLQLLGKDESPAIRQARKSLRLLERYVQAARKQLSSEGYETEFKVHQEIKQLMAVLKPLASKAGVNLIVEQDSPIKLYGDPVRFNQIVSNLIANAIDSYAGMENMSKSKPVTLTIKNAGRYLHLAVSDHGKGIEALQLTQIFEPFYTTKLDAGRGIGIGLSIVKQYVKNDYKGTICVNSSPQAGTTFTVLLKLQMPIKKSLL